MFIGYQRFLAKGPRPSGVKHQTPLTRSKRQWCHSSQHVDVPRRVYHADI